MGYPIHIAISVKEDCKNIEESYGCICVHCNKCGRYDKKEDKEKCSTKEN